MDDHIKFPLAKIASCEVIEYELDKPAYTRKEQVEADAAEHERKEAKEEYHNAQSRRRTTIEKISRVGSLTLASTAVLFVCTPFGDPRFFDSLGTSILASAPLFFAVAVLSKPRIGGLAERLIKRPRFPKLKLKAPAGRTTEFLAQVTSVEGQSVHITTPDKSHAENIVEVIQQYKARFEEDNYYSDFFWLYDDRIKHQELITPFEMRTDNIKGIPEEEDEFLRTRFQLAIRELKEDAVNSRDCSKISSVNWLMRALNGSHYGGLGTLKGDAENAQKTWGRIANILDSEENYSRSPIVTKTVISTGLGIFEKHALRLAKETN